MLQKKETSLNKSPLQLHCASDTRQIGLAGLAAGRAQLGLALAPKLDLT